MEKGLTASTQFCGPVHVRGGQQATYTINGTFDGTVELQINIRDPEGAVPASNSTNWVIAESFTAEAAKVGLAKGWYRLYCSAFTSGTIECTLRPESR